MQIAVTDGTETVTQLMQLTVLPSQLAPYSGAWLKRHLSVVPWRNWLEQGVGFLVLLLVHLLSMNLLTNLERTSMQADALAHVGDNLQVSVPKRFATYRLIVRLATFSAMAALAAWIFMMAAARV